MNPTETRRKRRPLSVLGVALVAAGALSIAPMGAPSASGLSETSEGKQLRRDVAAIHDLGVTGVVARARTPQGRFLARAGVADTVTRRPVPYGAHFRIGSSTKTYVATVVLQLVGEGRLSLDDTVESRLPGLVEGNGNDGTRITIRNLLQHTSGLADYVPDVPLRTAAEFRAHRFDTYTPRQLVTLALQHEPDFYPGATNPDGTLRWSYSNTGYIVLGMIIERVTGHTWGDNVRHRILEPLGLHDTVVPERPTLPRPHAHGYQEFTSGAPLSDVTVLNPSVLDAAGSMISTTADNSRFFRALVDGELLPPSLLAQMQHTVPTGWDGAYEGTRYGLGLFWYPLSCSKAGYWAHGGGSLGYVTREGVSADGRRSVTLSMSAQLAGGDADRQILAATAAVGNTLCSRQWRRARGTENFLRTSTSAL